MQFRVPKFLEREAKIVGPLTFSQTVYFAVAAIILVFLYFVLPTLWFAVCFLLLGGVTFSLAFVKIEGIPLPQLFLQSFGYFLSPKIYIWRKKEPLIPIKLVKEKRKEKKEVKEGPLKIFPKSRLKNLASKIEIGLR